MKAEIRIEQRNSVRKKGAADSAPTARRFEAGSAAYGTNIISPFWETEYKYV